MRHQVRTSSRRKGELTAHRNMLDNGASTNVLRQMNKIDQLKQLRLQEETNLLDADLVEEFARPVLEGLVDWSNKNIFSKHGGELSLEIPLGPPNAGVWYQSIEPLKPVVKIFRSMITDIYRDALTFPLICRRLVDETAILADLHDHDAWKGAPFAFSTAVPTLQPGHVHGDLAFPCEIVATMHEGNDESKIETNDVRCKFVMFELMLVWTFFHELGHVLQRHYRFRVTTSGLDNVDTFLEFTEDQPDKDLADNDPSIVPPSDLPAQARELMADAEAMDLTLKYIRATGRLSFPLVYLLHCSVSCMFQRFYQNYSESLNITSHRHPHPALREQVSEAFLADSISDFLVATKQVPDPTVAAIAVTYATVRANVFVGFFRATRIEQREEEDGLPSYMRLQSAEHRPDMLSYQGTLMPYIESQMVDVRQWHLSPTNRLDDWLEMLRRQQGRLQGKGGPF